MKLLSLLAGALAVAVIIKVLRKNRQSLVSPYNPPVESYKPVVDITV